MMWSSSGGGQSANTADSRTTWSGPLVTTDGVSTDGCVSEQPELSSTGRSLAGTEPVLLPLRRKPFWAYYAGRSGKEPE